MSFSAIALLFGGTEKRKNYTVVLEDTVSGGRIRSSESKKNRCVDLLYLIVFGMSLFVKMRKNLEIR